MTARWEERLGQMEQGAYTPEDFLAGIRGMLRELMGTAPGKQPHFKETPPVGRCPWCGGEVAEMQHGFFCGNQNWQICNLEGQFLVGRQAKATHPRPGSRFASGWARAAYRLLLGENRQGL